MTRTKAIFGFLNGMLPNGMFIVTAVSDCGQTLASVAVNSEDEGREALGMDGVSRSRHHIYKQHFPWGAELEWVPFVKTGTHRRLKQAINNHRRRYGV